MHIPVEEYACIPALIFENIKKNTFKRVLLKVIRPFRHSNHNDGYILLTSQQTTKLGEASLLFLGH